MANGTLSSTPTVTGDVLASANLTHEAANVLGACSPCPLEETLSTVNGRDVVYLGMCPLHVYKHRFALLTVLSFHTEFTVANPEVQYMIWANLP